MHISIYVVFTDGTERFYETKFVGTKSGKGILYENTV